MEKIATHTLDPNDVFFYLGNSPGVVYVGTEKDFLWFKEDGTCPGKLESPFVEDEDGPWPIVRLSNKEVVPFCPNPC